MTRPKSLDISLRNLLQLYPIEGIPVTRIYSLHSIREREDSFDRLEVINGVGIGETIEHGTLVDDIAGEEVTVGFIEQPDTAAGMSGKMNNS